MADTPRALLHRLQKLQARYATPGTAAEKLRLIRALDARPQARRVDLEALHETLLFLAAYPDDAEVRAAAEAALARFAARADLRRFRDELAGSGIDGCDTYFAFWWGMAEWLVGAWPDRVTIDWEVFDHQDWLPKLLPLLLPYSASPAVDELELSAREWLDHLKGSDETDAAFLVRRIAALPLDALARETLYENLDVPMAVQGGGGVPSRTRDRWPVKKVVYQTTPLDRARPDLHAAAREPLRSVRKLSRRDGEQLVALGRAAMFNRARDLDGFAGADPSDARLIDCGGGLCFGLLGLHPERRLMLETSYAMLTLVNGVPAGYVLISTLFGSAAVAYNIFEAFRGGRAAHTLGRVLAVAHQVFGATSFSIDPYQLGHHNPEGMASGAWWFYYKLGFRPADPAVQRVLRKELAKMRRDPAHRSDFDTLDALTDGYMHFHLGKPRADVLGEVLLGNIGDAIASWMAARYGSDLEAGLDACEVEARRLTGLRSLAGWSATERMWWRRWAPLLCALPGVARWPAAERRALAAVVRAKGSRHESDFVALCEGHARLRRALLKMAED